MQQTLSISVPLGQHLSHFQPFMFLILDLHEV